MAIAAGSGITPLMALIEGTLKASPGNTFTLVYTNRTAMDVMFLDELADLKDRYPARLALHHVLSRERRSSALLSGRIDAEKVRSILDTLIRPANVDEWFLCGPFDLVQLCRDTLAELGVDVSAIRYELFTTDRPDNLDRAAGRPVRPRDDDQVHSIEFMLDGTTATVTSPVHSNESILNAALRVRGDVPFACAGGVCGTCRAVLTRAPSRWPRTTRSSPRSWPAATCSPARPFPPARRSASTTTCDRERVDVASARPEGVSCPLN